MSTSLNVVSIASARSVASTGAWPRLHARGSSVRASRCGSLSSEYRLQRAASTAAGRCGSRAFLAVRQQQPRLHLVTRPPTPLPLMEGSIDDRVLQPGGRASPGCSASMLHYFAGWQSRAVQACFFLLELLSGRLEQRQQHCPLRMRPSTWLRQHGSAFFFNDGASRTPASLANTSRTTLSVSMSTIRSSRLTAVAWFLVPGGNGRHPQPIQEGQGL
jgi:hypothetical protein